MKMCIKGGRVIDPSQNIDMIADLMIVDGKVEGIYEPGTAPVDGAAEVIDAQGLWVVPGLIDTHVHFRDPGFEYKEDIITGCQAAAAGGFTTVCCMPNTKPVTDSVEVIKYIQEKAAGACGVRVVTAAAITEGQKGEKLTDFQALCNAGAVGLSEDGKSVQDLELMREAMKKAADLGLTIMDHTEQPEIRDGGCMNRGRFSEAAGLPGIPAEAEEMMTAREIFLAKDTGCRLHLQHISTGACFDLIRIAKKWGVNVTAETCPHYFTLSDGDVFRSDIPENTDPKSLNYNLCLTPTGKVADTHRKMNPPLRTRKDMYATVSALMDGTIDAICTDHAPHSAEEKSRDIQEAPFGVVGLETSFAVSYTELVGKDFINPMRLIALMSTNPARILGVEGGSFKEGMPGDVAIIDTSISYTISSKEFKSRGRNTAFEGRKVKGRIMKTIVGGKVVYER